MRTTIFLLAVTAASASATSIWARQASAPPACAAPCLNTGTNGVPLGDCGSSDIVCQCRSPTYVQGVVNCLATYCADHADVMTAYDFSTSYCGIAGVNTPAPGVTIPSTQLQPTSTGSGSSSGSATAAPSSAASNASAAPSSTSSRNGAGALEPRAFVAALVLAAVGFAAAV